MGRVFSYNFLLVTHAKNGGASMEKMNVYVSVSDLTSNFHPGLSNEFVLSLEPTKARIFQRLFTQMQHLEASNALRAHIPYIQYHDDPLNHEIDTRLKKVYALIHEYGDEETKQFVEQLPYFSKPIQH